jgi:DNA transformation protein
MAVSAGQIDYVKGQLERLGPVTVKKMFGGAGLYADGLFFGLIDSSDAVYLKVDDTNRADYEAAGSAVFHPRTSGGKTMAMPYMTVPEDVLEDPDALAAWARKAIAVAAKGKR